VVDFKIQLGRQIRFIKNSCELYDRGDFEEAIRIATALRVLFHDSKHSVSLIKHLGKFSIKLRSTTLRFPQHPEMPNLHLVKLITGVVENIQCQAQPTLADAPRSREIPFVEWWSGEPVIELKQPTGALTRKELALAAANKDGGAHVDKSLPLIYDETRRGAGLTMEFDFKDKRPTLRLAFENIHYATLRQVAYEVLNSPALVGLMGK
jgi:hypothetical protein